MVVLGAAIETVADDGTIALRFRARSRRRSRPHG